MARLWLAVLVTSCTALLVSCGGKKDSVGLGVGTLFVSAFDANHQPLADVQVSTDPETETRVTDEFGSALFEHEPIGAYRVLGIRGTERTSTAAMVIEGETASAELVFALSQPGGSGGDNSSGGDDSSDDDDSSGGSSHSSGGASHGGSSGSSVGHGGGASVGGGTYIDVGTQVAALVADAERPYLYALDSVNNNMLFINLDTQQVDKTIFVGSKPVDLDFDAVNKNAYIANWGSSEIAVVDLVHQKVDHSIFVDTTAGTWQGNPYRIAVTASNTLVFTEEDQWCDLKLVDASTGVNIKVSGSLYEPDLAVTKDRSTLYVGESALSSTTLTRFSVASTGLTKVDISGDAGSFGEREVTLSGDNKYVFFAGQKYLAANLKSVLGKFSEAIYASNADGSVVVGNKSVFNGNTFAITSVLPVSTTVLAMSPDDSTVYLYDTAKSRIYIHPL